MTKQFDVKLNTQREQVDCARVCNRYSFDILLCKGSYEVDAKSILGICSMDTSEGCHVKIHALSTDSQVEKFVDDVKEYINE